MTGVSLKGYRQNWEGTSPGEEKEILGEEEILGEDVKGVSVFKDKEIKMIWYICDSIYMCFLPVSQV